MDYNGIPNGSNPAYYYISPETPYDKYLLFAVGSALFGLPANILLLVILIRISPFSRRFAGTIRSIPTSTTGSFERFLFEVILVDTLLIIYHFVDNFLSYINDDRSAGQYYLIHVSDFCCKFFTYIVKMSILLTTWLLLFLIVNQVIHTMENKNNSNQPRSTSFWNRGLHFVNAKYSTVFLIFVFSVYNIYPIEVLKYQKKNELKDSRDYQQSGGVGVCWTSLDGKSSILLKVTNYGYNILGVAIPCLIMVVLSVLLIYRACRMKNPKNNNNPNNTNVIAFHYIAAIMGIAHAVFNLPGRLSDILMMFLSPYRSYYYFEIMTFGHEAKSFIPLSYAYKCFVCIFLCRHFRLHAKSILCFLIENKYDDHRHLSVVVQDKNWNQRLVSHEKNRKKYRRHYYHRQHKEQSQLTEAAVHCSTSSHIPLSLTSRDDWHHYISASASWIRPYFTRHEQRHLLRPCGRSVSCHQLSTTTISFSSFPPVNFSNIHRI